MKCSEIQELVVAQAEGVLDERQALVLADHLRSCPACRAEAEGLLRLHARLVGDGRAFADARPDGRIMRSILRESTPNLRRTNIMYKRVTRWSLAAASVAAVLALVLLLGVGRHGSQAYALEQTVKAYRGMRAVHLKFEPAGNGVAEAWAEFGSGLARSTDVLDAESTLAESRFTLVNQHYNAYLKQGALLTIVGEDLPAFYANLVPTRQER